MVRPLTTTEVSRQLNVPTWRLIYLVQNRKITTPERDSSLNYLWWLPLVEEARQALAARPQKASVP